MFATSAVTFPTSARAHALRVAIALLLPYAACACGDDDGWVCSDQATCFCPAGARCEASCAAPPCHIECVADNPACTAECANGDCACGERSVCDFACHSPPCLVSCEPGAACSGECANGSCRCERGASCQFRCQSGPCHVQCAGEHPRCDGECSNGSCTCGPNSECHFACVDRNCAVSCAAGSRCVLECPQGMAGMPGCAFTSCAAGAPRVCPGGLVTTCGAECP